MNTLEFKGRKRKTFKIDQSGLAIITYANPSLPNRSHIPFENIRSDRFYYRQRNYQYLLVAGILLIFSVFMLAASTENKETPAFGLLGWTLPAFIFILVFFIHQPRLFYLKTFQGGYIKFQVSKNEAEIDAFVNTLIEKRNDYIKLAYGQPSVNMDYDRQYSNFNIMLREHIISTEEYKNKIDELNSYFNRDTPTKVYMAFSQN